MDINRFNLYSMATENEQKASKEHDKIMQQIEAMKECKTIRQIKTFLKENWNITECVENYKLGTVGFLTTNNSDSNFEVTVSYADEVHTFIFPKLIKTPKE